MFDTPPDNSQTTVQDVELPIPPVSQETQRVSREFTRLKAEDYTVFKEDFLRWLLTQGKDPFRGHGYSESVTRTTSYKIDQIFRWLWQERGEYTREFTEKEATNLIGHLIQDPNYSDTATRIFEKSIKRYFKYLNHTQGHDHDFTISQSDSDRNLDYFKQHELRKLYDAALEFGSLKHYANYDPEEREKVAAYLAQRYEKPKSEIGPKDFDRANSWKFPSLIAVCNDVGLRSSDIMGLMQQLGVVEQPDE